MYSSKSTPYGIWLPIIIDLGAMASLTTVAFSCLLGQSRIFYSMAQDGLLPEIFTKIHPRTKVPWISVIIIGEKFYLFLMDQFRNDVISLGIACAIMSAIFPLGTLGEMASIGTVVCFLRVHIAVIIVSLKQSSMNFV